MTDPNPVRPSLWSRLTKTLFPRNTDALAGPPANPARTNNVGWAASQKDKEIFEGKEPFLSPAQPLDPKMPQGEPPRRFQVPPGYNLQISPRSTEQISFAQLRAVSEYTVIRIIIEHVKESLKAHEWDITTDDENETGKYEGDIKIVREFFEMPDRVHTWDEWIGELIEEILVIDACTIFKRRTRGGKLYGLEIIDGATIKTLSDYRGMEPLPPAPAYQQFIFGVPYAAYTRDEMYYLPRNRRSHKFYGFGPIEQMIVTVNQGLRREMYSLAQLSDGNIPAGVGSLPKEWKLEDIKAYQEYWDAIMAGDAQNRARIRFVPEGFDYTKFHDGTDGDGMGIFSPFDEWLARIMCFGIGISPMPFIKLTNKSVAEEMGDVESEGGVASLKLFIERTANRVIDYELGYPHLRFNWVTDRARLQAKRVSRNTAYVAQGIFQIDEVRAEEGKDPLGLPPGYPTASGYVTFAGAVAQEQAAIEGQNAQTEATLNPPSNPNQIDPKTGKPFEGPKPSAQEKGPNGKGKNPKKETDTPQSKAQKAFDKCRAEELDKWERFALSRLNSVEKMTAFDPEFLSDVETWDIGRELRAAFDTSLLKSTGPAIRKTFEDEVRHVFATRRMKVQPIRLAPAAARDAAHRVGDLKNVLTSVFQREAVRLAHVTKAAGVVPIKPIGE